MSIKRIVPRKQVQGRVVGRAKKGSLEKRKDSGLGRQLQDVREQVEIVLPEMTDLSAAWEHLLLEKQLGIRQYLSEARKFVKIQKRGRAE